MTKSILPLFLIAALGAPPLASTSEPANTPPTHYDKCKARKFTDAICHQSIFFKSHDMHPEISSPPHHKSVELDPHTSLLRSLPAKEIWYQAARLRCAEIGKPLGRRKSGALSHYPHFICDRMR